MTNILTAAQASNFIRTDTADAVMLQLLPLVDQYLLSATGHDWAADSTIHPSAIAAAGMLIVYWYDNPGAFGQVPTTVRGMLVQLEAEALKYRKGIFSGAPNAGAVSLKNARRGDKVVQLVGVYGVTDNQSAKFESAISVNGQIQQTDGSDLSENIYVVVLKHPADDVSA